MKCYLNQEVAQKMHYYVQSVNSEISGIARSEIVDGDIYITDIKIRKQKCSGSRTIIDEEDDQLEAFNMVKAGEDLNKWNVWWHSHHTMGVFWSGTDTGTIKELCGGGAYFISIVTNKKGEYKTRLDVFPKDMSPLGIVTHALAEDDIETIVLPLKIDEPRKEELKTFLDKKTIEYDDRITLIEKDIKEKIELLESSKSMMIKEIEDEYYANFGMFENELLLLEENTILEDQELKNIIATEVANKVSVEDYAIKKYVGGKQTKIPYTGKPSHEEYLPSYNYNKRGDDYYDTLFKARKRFTDMTDEELDEYITNGYVEHENGYPINREIGFTTTKEELEAAEEEADMRDYNNSFAGYKEVPEVGIYY